MAQDPGVPADRRHHAGTEATNRTVKTVARTAYGFGTWTTNAAAYGSPAPGTARSAPRHDGELPLTVEDPPSDVNSLGEKQFRGWVNRLNFNQSPREPRIGRKVSASPRWVAWNVHGPFEPLSLAYGHPA